MFNRFFVMENEFTYAHTAAEVWPYIVDPRVRQSFEKDTCYRVQVTSELNAAVGDRWTEVHTGEDCEGDIVDWQVTILNAPYIYQSTSTFMGICQNHRFTLKPQSGGCVLEERIVFAPRLSKNVGKMLMMWLLLFTGLLQRFANDPEEVQFWFRALEAKMRDESIA